MNLYNECNVNDLVEIACEQGDLEIIKRVHFLHNLDNLCNLEEILIGAAKCNKINIIEWLFENFNFFFDDITLAFIRACVAGHLETAKWFYLNTNVDINTQNNYVLRHACLHNRLEVVRWLFSVENELDQPYSNNAKGEAFCTACYYGNLEIAKILYEAKIDIKCRYYIALMHAKKNSRREIVEWLHEIKNKIE